MTSATDSTAQPTRAAAPGTPDGRPTAARRDLVALVLFGVLTFALARRFDLFTRLVAGARRLEGAGDDALIVTILALAFALKVYAWRRWREARRALAARSQAEVALRASEVRLRLLTRQLPAFLWTTDADLRLTAFLGGGFRISGIDPRGRVGKTVAAFFGTDDPAFPPLAAHRRALGGDPAEYPLRRDGRTYEVRVEPLRDAAGSIVGTLGLGIDVTERERAAAALRDSEARFRALFEHAAIGIGLSDLERRPLMVNPALARFTGYDSAEELQRPIPEATHPDDAARDRAHYAALVAGACDSYQLEKRYRRKDGAEVHGRLTTSLVRDAAGAPKYVIGMVEDITARVAAQAERDAARRRLMAAREEERLALARELHDEAIQELLGIRLVVQLARRALDPATADAEVMALLGEGERTFQEVVERLRRIVSGLRPAGLEELGLIAALEGYAAHVRRKEAGTPLAVATDLDDGAASLAPALARALFRVAQEGLRNVRRHADARRATVTLRVAAGVATLRVADDGRGFAAPPDLPRLAREDHFGLVGLAEQLADDHALVRAGLRAILAAEPDLALAGEAATGDEARALCAARHPDVLLLDLRMPGPPATETVAWVRARCPATRVVILTAHREDALVRGLLDRGAVGYVLKDDALEAVPQAVRAVAAGGTWLSAQVLPALLRPPAEADDEPFTPREREVLELLAAERDNRAIAVELGIGVRTVESHVRSAFAKLGARSRAEARQILRRRALRPD